MSNPVKNLFFEPLPDYLLPEDRSALSWEDKSLKPYCKTIDLKAGEKLIETGEMPTACYLVKSGIVIASEPTPKGESRMYNFNQFNPEGILLFDAHMAMKSPVMADFTAMVDSTVIEIDYDGLCKVAQEDPKIFHQLIYSLSLKFMTALEQIRSINCHSLIWRYCSLLLLLAEQTGIETPEGIVIKNTFTQTEMANYLNVSRTSLHFECTELRDKNLIIQQKRKIIIPSIEKLKAYRNAVAERKISRSDNKKRKRKPIEKSETKA